MHTTLIAIAYREIQDYYSLTWRFLAATGCSVHQCRLLECCGHCGNFIPLFTTRARLGICSLCGEDLRSCPTLTLSVQETDIVQRCTTDIEYLLSPQGNEEDKDAAITIGLKYKALRQAKQIDCEQVAEKIEVPLESLKGVEKGNHWNGASFQTYVKYAQFLDTTLHTIFTNTFTLHSEPELPRQQESINLDLRQQMRQQREDDLLKQVRAVIWDLESLEEPITLRSISKRIGLTPEGLKQYPSIKALWEQTSSDLKNERRRQRLQGENALEEQIQQAILVLKSNGHALSAKVIGEYVHRSQWQLWRMPRINKPS